MKKTHEMACWRAGKAGSKKMQRVGCRSEARMEEDGGRGDGEEGGAAWGVHRHKSDAQRERRRA